MSVWSSSQLWSESTGFMLEWAACLMLMEEEKSPTQKYGTTLCCDISQVTPAAF